MALGPRQLQFLVKELVVEADIPGVFGSIGKINFLDPGPVDGGETHGAGFATGVDFASHEVEGVELECCLSDGHDLRMGCGIFAGEHLIDTNRLTGVFRRV